MTHAYLAPTMRIQAGIDALEEDPIPEAELVDAVGAIDYLIKQLRTIRNGLLAETPPKAKGLNYRAVESRKATRTYNTQGLLAKMMERLDTDAAGAVRYLMEHDAVRLTWRWTELKDVSHRVGLTMVVAPREIEDGDPEALVGETWSTSTRVLGVTE